MSSPTPPSELATKRRIPVRVHERAVGPINAPAASKDATGAFVASRIEAAQSALWRAELTRRILTIVIAVLAIVLAWLVLDQWVYSAGPLGRTLIAAGLIVAMIAYIYLRLWPVMHLRISEDYAARALERDHPELGHALSSYISLRRQHADHPQGQLAQRVVQSVGSGAAAKLRRIDAPPSEATGLATWWAAMISLLASVAIYTLASPKNSAQSVARLALPMSSLEAPKRVQIRDVSPGHTESLAGRSLEVAATVVNLRDDEPVYFRWDTGKTRRDRTVANASDSQTSSRDQIRLLPSDTAEDPNRFRASVQIPHHAHGTRQYRIVAGDASAGPFQISIRNTPVVQIREVVYDPPAYTGKSRHSSRTGTLRGIDGTRVKLAAAVNRPITRAVIEFNPRKVGRDVHATAGVREMEIAADGTNIEFTFPLRLRGGAAIALQDYRLRVWDDAGQSNADPIVYPIEIVEDLPPEITIVVPQHSPVDVPINGQQSFEIHAADVDFGLAEVEIEIRRGIDLIARSSLWKEPAGKRGNHVVEYRFRPSRIIIAGRAGADATRRGSGLNVGDEVEVVAIATDNRVDPDDDTITPGVTKTQPVRLRITAASQQQAGEEQGQQGESQQGEEQQGEGQQGEGQQGEGQQGEGQQGEGQQGEGQQGEGQQGEGQQGEGQQGEGQQGEGQQGEGQQGEGQQGEGQQGEGQQGEGQQGEGQQGEGQQGEGQQGEGKQGEMGGSNSGESEQTQNDNAGSGQDGSAGGANDDASDPAGASSSEADGGESQSQQGNANSPTGERGSKPGGQSTQPPQDDAEAFERIQEYLKQNQQKQPSSNATQGNGESNDDTNSGQNQAGENDSTGGEDGGQGTEQETEQETEPRQPATGESGNGESSDDRSGQNQSGGNQSSDGQSSDGQHSDGQRDGQAGEEQGDQGKSGGSKASEQTPGDEGQKRSGDEAEQINGQDQNAERQDDRSENADGETSREGEGASEAAGEGEGDGANATERPRDADNSNDADNSSGAEDVQAGDEQNDARRSDEGQSGDQGNAQQNQMDNPAGEQPSKESADGSDSGSETSGQLGANGDHEQTGASGEPAGTDPAGNSPTSPDASDSPQGGGGGQSGAGPDHAPGMDDELPDPVDLEYTKAATDMVLDYIDETRTDPDPDLLQRLKWSEEDLRRFRERWQNVKPIEGGPRSDNTATNDIEEALRSLGMRPRQITQSNRRDAADDVRSLRDSGNRRPAPADVRDAFEAFRRGLGQSSTRSKN